MGAIYDHQDGMNLRWRFSRCIFWSGPHDANPFCGSNLNKKYSNRTDAGLNTQDDHFFSVSDPKHKPPLNVFS
jgi:hypothetical protein